MPSSLAAWALVTGALLSTANACDAKPAAPGPDAAPSTVRTAAAPSAAGSAAASPDGAFVREWFALGSGCRAKFDQPGDVTFEEIAPDLRAAPDAGPNETRHLRFHLPAFALDAGPAVPRDFVRDCAIRAGLMTPPHRRLVGVAARAHVSASAGHGTTLLTLSQTLKIGAEIVDTAEHALSPGADAASAATGDWTLELRSKAASFPALACAEPKIFAFDFTWKATRSDPNGEAHAALAEARPPARGGARALDVDVTMAPCD
jgi:hypothetical protein